MISRKLFFKLTWEEIKAKLAIILGVMITYFMYMPTGFLFFLENDFGIKGSMIQNYMASLRVGIYLFLIVWAVVTAMATFGYLHSRKKVDFYHSFPIKREILFGIKYVTGFLSVMVPYALQLIFMYVIAVCQGEFQTADIKAFFIDLIVKMVLFLLIYTVSVLAVMLTGQLVTAICGIGVLLGYAVVLYNVIIGYFHVYFTTCSEGYFTLANEFWERLVKFVSPFWTFVSVMTGSVKYLGDDRVILCFPEYEVMIAGVIIVVCLVASVVLYHFRPSESAGKAMAFKKSEPVIKVAIVVLAAISISLIMRLMAATNPDMGTIFGFLLGSVCFAGLMEAIYRSDVRAVVQKKKHLLIAMAIAGVVIIIFRFDLLGYNTWIPDSKEVDSVALCIGDNYELTECYEEDDFLSIESYILDNMKLKENSAVYTLVGNAVEALDDNSDESYTAVLVKYNMKNGSKRYRQYYIDFSKEENWNTYNELYQEEEYVKGIFPILNENEAESKVMMQYGIIQDGEGYYFESSERADLTEEQCKNIYETYKSELAGFTPEKCQNEQIVAYVNWYDKKLYEQQGDMIPGWVNTYPVYESFTATRDLMKAYNIKSYELHAKDVQEIILSDADTGFTDTYKEKEQIEALLPLFPAYEYCYTPDINKYAKRTDMQVIVGVGENANCFYRWFNVDDPKVPDFVK